MVARSVFRRAGDSAWLALAIFLFALQQIGIRQVGVDGVAGMLRRGIFFSSTIILMVLALRFRRYIGAWLIALGIGLNLLPMAAHGGLMPISYRVVHESGAFPEITQADLGRQLGNGKDILLRDNEIRFEPLSDRYTLTLPGYGTNIYSLGDFVLFGGVGLVVLQAAATPLIGQFRRRPPSPIPSSR